MKYTERDSEVRRMFTVELERCQCRSCTAIVAAVFANWLEPETVRMIMDAFIKHTTICYYHRYQAHQDG